MMPGLLTTLLLALSLLISAAMAHAECAWVASSNFLNSHDGPKLDDRESEGSIETGPIPLDSEDPRYSGYLGRVSQMIKARWVYPCVKNETTRRCEYKSARLVVIFGIAKDGRLDKVEVQESSGYGIYDEYAVNAINSASPFPPVPPELMARTKPESAGVRIVAPFRYVSVESPRFRLPDTVDPRGPKLLDEGARSYDQAKGSYYARRAYFDQVRQRVQLNLESPCVLKGVTCEYKVTDVSVEFSVAKDGRVGLVVVRSPSPWPIYNEYSVRAVRLASPFPSIPDEAGFSIRMTFRYSTGRQPELLVE